MPVRTHLRIFSSRITIVGGREPVWKNPLYSTKQFFNSHLNILVLVVISKCLYFVIEVDSSSSDDGLVDGWMNGASLCLVISAHSQFHYSLAHSVSIDLIDIHTNTQYIHTGVMLACLPSQGVGPEYFSSLPPSFSCSPVPLTCS